MPDWLANPTVDDLAHGIESGDRTLLARAITLVESTRDDHRALAAALVHRVLPRTGRARRIGVSGVPGAGKSTFLDALGSLLTQRGHRVAVLAIDPSSQVTGGSILGDKTRMERLARDRNAFIRPSPGGDALGGVAHHSREAILLCEAAGFDVVFVETIGVGQAEVAVAQLVDTFVLLALGGTGDELQGIKRGITELADVVVVHKADGDQRQRAVRAQAEIASALQILHHDRTGWQPPVLLASSHTGEGLAAVWDAIERHRDGLGSTGLAAKRQAQALHAFEQTWREAVLHQFAQRPGVAARLAALRDSVARGELPAESAARAALGGDIGTAG